MSEFSPRRAVGERPMSLLDQDALRAAFAAHTAGQANFTRRMAITIADMFDLRSMSLVWKLEKAGLLKRGSWEWFKTNGGITADQVRQVRQEHDHDLEARSPDR